MCKPVSEFVSECGGYLIPNYDNPLYIRPNPCSELFCECEGDCDNCPNKPFFEAFRKEKNEK